VAATLDNILQAILALVQAQNAQAQALKGGQSLTYATGTWTPALQFGGASTGLAYSVQAGTYTQIGREIVCRFRIVLTAVGSATGSATIAGLPFASNADQTNGGAGGTAAKILNMASLTSVPILSVGASSSVVSLLENGASGASALTNSNFTATTEIDGHFGYFV
jgi:hypothetical protein